jgi:hypothetical protein
MQWHLYPAATFDQHAMEWDRLQSQTTRTPFLESGFISPMLSVFGTGNEHLAMLRDGHAVLAATLLRPLGRGRWETFQPSQLPLGPWIGDGQHAMSHMAALMRKLPGLTLSLGLTQMDPKLVERPTDSQALRTLDYVSTSYIDITGDFDAYWEGRGKNLRQNTRKQRNKLIADGVVTRLACTVDPSGVAGAIQAYGELESAGWKANTGTAIHPDNKQGSFYRQMLENFSSVGRARLYRYYFGDQVVAMDLCIDDGPLVVILKTAYDESHKQLSPSTLMRQDEFREWWDEGRYRRIEFYGKTLEWHTRWTDKERLLYHMTAYRWGWVANVASRQRRGALAPI